MVGPRLASAQAPARPETSTAGLTRFEMQRTLLEIDEQRRRMEASLEPVDSVLRTLESDTARIAAASRSRLVDRDMDRVWGAAGVLRQAPDAFIDAVRAVARDFAVPDSMLGARVVSTAAAAKTQPVNAAVVIVDDQRPPYNTVLWDKIRMSEFGKSALPSILNADIGAFHAAVSDSGFRTYKQTLIAAFTRRMAEIRQSRELVRADIQRLRKRAATLAHAIGTQEGGANPEMDARLINFGVPAFGIVLIVLLLMPLMYKRPEMQQWLLTSGMLLELATIILVAAVTLLLALSGRIPGAIVGTLLGALSGYSLGRATQRRSLEHPLANPVATLPPPATSSTTSLPPGQRVTPAQPTPTRVTPPPRVTPPRVPPQGQIAPPPLAKRQ